MPLTAGANPGGIQRLGPTPKEGSSIRQEVVRPSQLHIVKQRRDSKGLNKQGAMSQGGKGSLKLPHPLCPSSLVSVSMNISGDPGGLFAPQQDCESRRWMPHLGYCRIWAWNHLVLGTAMGLTRAEDREPGHQRGCQQGLTGLTGSPLPAPVR